LLEVDGLLRLLSRDTESDLHDQRDRIVELLIAQTAQNPWSLSQRRLDCQNYLPGDQPGGEEMDDADSGLESRSQSVRHPVRRQGAGVNTSYTVIHSIIIVIRSVE
jgi:hypothetical protein